MGGIEVEAWTGWRARVLSISAARLWTRERECAHGCCVGSSAPPGSMLAQAMQKGNHTEIDEVATMT
jgi:hypothetical protein